MKKNIILGLVACLAAFPSAAFANHALGGIGSPYHWAGSANPRTITISDGVTLGDNAYNFSGVVADWNSFGSGYVSLTTTTSSKPNIKTERGSYGNNGWLGLSQFWLKNGHFSRILVKLNDWYAPYYPQYYTLDARQQTLCQEVGHGLGLDHQYSNSCMNDQTDPAVATYPHPNSHDGAELAAIYQHPDPSGGGKGQGRNPREAGPYILDVIPAPRQTATPGASR